MEIVWTCFTKLYISNCIGSTKKVFNSLMRDVQPTDIIKPDVNRTDRQKEK